MALKIIGAGFGRTGTMSLKLALEELGYGPCHHMKEVIGDPEQIALWRDVAEGRADYDRIFRGYFSAVDFPVAACWQDVLAAYPGARVILSAREAEEWYDSFSNTILKIVLDRDAWPDSARPWYEMLEAIVVDRALGGRTDREGILKAYRANVDAARALAEDGRALIHSARDGWGPLCAFLSLRPPAEPYPRTNAREAFLPAVRAGTGQAEDTMAR